MLFHHQRDFSPMSVALQARDWTRDLEEREARKSGVPVKQARAIVARKVGATPAAIEHVARGRAKRIPADLFARLRNYFIRELSSEIAAAQHQLEVARQCGMDPRCPEMAALEAGAAAARKLMERKP
jgi:hypothetical protein